MKYTLDILPDYDFLLLGISSHEKDYRLAWALNKVLSVEFQKVESLEMKDKKQSERAYFSTFYYGDEEDIREYYILSNSSENKTLSSQENTLFGLDDFTVKNELLIPERKTANYFFVLKGSVDLEEVDRIIEAIRSIQFVLTVDVIEVEELKSKQNLIF